MKNITWKIDNITFDSLISNYGTVVSGATLPLQGMYPNEFLKIGVNERDNARNDYYGMTVSSPPNRTDSLVFGFSYFDNQDKETDEDIYILNKSSQELTYFPKGSYEKDNPLYVDTHKGIKDYLIPQTGNVKSNNDHI